MKQSISVVITLVVLLFAAAAFAQSPKVREQAHKTTHHLVFSGEFSCSGTAIGRFALLTASHCTDETPFVEVDGAKYQIYQVISDNLDHSILLVIGDAFKDYANVSLDIPKTGDEVFVFGNPSNFRDLFRKGYVAGCAHTIDNSVCTLMMDMNEYFGDSGSGVFNDKGDVVAVMNAVRVLSDKGTPDLTAKFAESFELRISPDALRVAVDFAPQVPKKEK